VLANDNVNLSVDEGEIHAVCGENGAGKSTLMKILYGMQSADSGRMLMSGEEVEFGSPAEAIDAGIGMVHQHFMLADQLTVLENVILGAEPVRTDGRVSRWLGAAVGLVSSNLGDRLRSALQTRIDFREGRKHLEEVGAAYGLEVDADDLVESLEIGERQRVEIIKVLYRGAKILILDEPTAVLVPHEVDELFRNMRELKADGSTILFIDHKLDEVLEIADTVTVLRQGRTVGTVKPENVSARDLAEMMIGSELPSPDTGESTVTDEVALDIRDVTVLDEDERTVVDNVSLSIHRGEIIGIAGVEGNGQTELVAAVMGIGPVTAGTITLLGKDVTHTSVRHRRHAGLGYVPQDRHRDGLLLAAPLWENVALGHQTKTPYVNGPWLDRPGMRSRTDQVVDEFDVRTPNINVTAHALSGGNQQKLIIGREMVAGPAVLIAAHPTRGIDVGAQAAVWDIIREARANGLATLLISADLDELIGLSDAIVVMLRGRFVARLDPSDITPRDLGAHMTGATMDEGAPS
jgi:simple sugar transport system ATP-binding protein